MSDLVRYLVVNFIFSILFPSALAYYRVKRTKGHPFISSLVYPGFLGGLYFATNYILNLKTAERIAGEPGFHHIIGYTDPFSLWPNLLTLFYVCIWTIFTGFIGYGFFKLTKKKPIMPYGESSETPNS